MNALPTIVSNTVQSRVSRSVLASPMRMKCHGHSETIVGHHISHEQYYPMLLTIAVFWNTLHITDCSGTVLGEVMAVICLGQSP